MRCPSWCSQVPWSLASPRKRLGKLPNADDLACESIGDREVELESGHRRLLGLGDPGGDVVPRCDRHRVGDSARHDSGRVDLAAGDRLDDGLAERTKPDSSTGDLGLGGHQSEDVPGGRVRVHPQQQIGGAEVEEAEGVALGDLAEVGEGPQCHSSRGGLHAHDGVTGLGGRQQVADRTDAAGSGREAGHFEDGPSSAELLESPELGDVEPSVGHLAGLVEVDRDLGVAFDAGHRVDGHEVMHRVSSSESDPFSTILGEGAVEYGRPAPLECGSPRADNPAGRRPRRSPDGAAAPWGGGQVPPAARRGSLRRGRPCRRTPAAGSSEGHPAGCAWR